MCSLYPHNAVNFDIFLSSLLVTLTLHGCGDSELDLLVVVVVGLVVVLSGCGRGVVTGVVNSLTGV